MSSRPDSTPPQPPAPPAATAAGPMKALVPEFAGEPEPDFRRGVGRWLQPEAGSSAGGCLGVAIAGLIVGGVTLAAFYSYLTSHLH